jgi:hypothetical protein
MTPLKWTSCGLVATVAAIQFVRPARTNPPIDHSRTLLARMHVPADTAAVLDRACRDCHSNETRWPWYSHVAPASWFVIEHVNHGRSHFNYSDWARYDRVEAARLIKNSCDLARKGGMPLPSYLRAHREARLARSDVEALCDWTPAITRRW